ncbi:hypothetical protein [Kaistella sp.]|uniref:hypothetical protein n=1 Tax=Kaistella sp. TaxID=2782235 RepID=UPI003C38C9C5
MKAYLNKIYGQQLPEEIRKKLQQLVMDQYTEMVFLSREYFCSVPTITVILGKSAEKKVQETLQREGWIRNSLTQQQMIISIHLHSANDQQVNLHFSYMLFNCYTRHLIYARTEKSWNSMFQNLYSEKQAKNQKLFQQWITPIIRQCEVYEAQFIKSQIPNPSVEVMGTGIKTMYSTLFSAFREFFLPRPLHQNFEGTKILVFMEQYISGVGHSLRKISITAIEEFLTSTAVNITQDRMEEQLNYVAILKEVLQHQLSNLFHRQLTQTLSWNQYAAVYEQPKTAVKKVLPDLPSQVSQIINEHFKPDYIYLHQMKDAQGKPTKLLLIIVGEDLKITHLQRIQHLLKPHFPEYEFTILLHKTEWLKKHYALFYGFIDRYLHRDHLIYQRRAVLTYPKKLERERDLLVRDYWKERKRIIEVHWTNIGFGCHAFHETQIIYLRSIFQQLFLGTLYHYAHYLPNTLNLNYLWELLEFFAPEIPARLMMSRPMKEIIAYVNEPDQNFPMAESAPAETSTLLFHEAVACCSQLYQNLLHE